MRLPLIPVLSLILLCVPVYSQFSTEGQLSGWLASSSAIDWHLQAGVRYLPAAYYQINLNDDISLDADVALNATAQGSFRSFSSADGSARLKAYRASMRLFSSQFELRAGLQKLSFGSAMMLRPLMWFDQIDPRDPLQLTDGVYGLLGRYYWIDNATFWVWVLNGNDNQKGWEVFRSASDKPEIGGRIQLPVFDGEAALTVHRRTAQGDGVLVPTSTTLTENRIALDGKWDVGIGIWFESVLMNTAEAPKQLRNQTLTTLGADYTFDIGNGLTLMAEQMFAKSSADVFRAGAEQEFTALSATYPLGLLDTVTGILYYNKLADGWYRFIRWQRQYDTFGIYIMAFWNPDFAALVGGRAGAPVFAGKGFQVMIVYNY